MIEPLNDDKYELGIDFLHSDAARNLGRVNRFFVPLGIVSLRFEHFFSLINYNGTQNRQRFEFCMKSLCFM